MTCSSARHRISLCKLKRHSNSDHDIKSECAANPERRCAGLYPFILCHPFYSWGQVQAEHCAEQDFYCLLAPPTTWELHPVVFAAECLRQKIRSLCLSSRPSWAAKKRHWLAINHQRQTMTCGCREKIGARKNRSLPSANVWLTLSSKCIHKGFLRRLSEGRTNIYVTCEALVDSSLSVMMEVSQQVKKSLQS